MSPANWSVAVYNYLGISDAFTPLLIQSRRTTLLLSAVEGVAGEL